MLKGAVSQRSRVILNGIKAEDFQRSKKLRIKTVKVHHGNVDSICYIIDKKLAYISDVSDINKKNYKYFTNLKYLIIDCLWIRNHPSHLNLERCMQLIKKFKPNKAILTNLSHELDYKFLL